MASTHDHLVTITAAPPAYKGALFVTCTCETLKSWAPDNRSAAQLKRDHLVAHATSMAFQV